MNGRQRTLRALKFEAPDRAPRDLWALPGVITNQPDDLDDLRRDFPMDLFKCEISPGEIRDDGAEASQYVDDWGSTWHRAESGVVGEVKEPALADWGKLDDFEPPWDMLRARDLSYVDRQGEKSSSFVLSAVTARPFERVQFLRGSESLYTDIGYDRPEFARLLEIVHAYYLQDVSTWCRTDVDGVMLMDDWGSRNSLLISPESWRDIFKPIYKAYCDLIHQSGKYVFFHSDGFIEPIIGDLIDVGVDALNSQLFTMDIEKIAAEFGGAITFWGEIDRQVTLPFGDPAAVKEAVHRVRRALDRGMGGVIAQCEWGKANPSENIRAVFEAWLEPLD